MIGKSKLMKTSKIQRHCFALNHILCLSLSAHRIGGCSIEGSDSETPQHSGQDWGKQLVPNTCWSTDKHMPSATTQTLSPRLVEAKECPASHWPPWDLSPLQQVPFLLTTPWFYPELWIPSPPTGRHVLLPPETRYEWSSVTLLQLLLLLVSDSYLITITLSNVWKLTPIPPILVLFLINSILTETQLLYSNSYYYIHFKTWIEV